MNENLRIGAGYVLICLLWGSTWLAIRLGLDSMTPILSAGLRFLLASIFIIIIMKIKGLKLQLSRHFIKLYILLCLFSFVISFGLVYWGEQYVPSGLASVLFGVFPFMVIIFSRIMLPDQRIGPYQTIGVVLGFVGLIVIFSKNITFSFDNNLLGMAAIVTSAAIQGYVAALMKKNVEHLHPLSLNFIPLFFAGVIMIAAALLFEDLSNVEFNIKAVSSIVYLAFFGTVATFTTYYWLMKKINVVILSLSAFITPIVSVILGWLVLDEIFTIRDLAGASMVLMGILFANFRGLIKYYKNKPKLEE